MSTITPHSFFDPRTNKENQSNKTVATTTTTTTTNSLKRTLLLSSSSSSNAINVDDDVDDDDDDDRIDDPIDADEYEETTTTEAVTSTTATTSVSTTTMKTKNSNDKDSSSGDVDKYVSNEIPSFTGKGKAIESKIGLPEEEGPTEEDVSSTWSYHRDLLRKNDADETNMLVNEDDTDRHGNTVIKIDIPGPVRMKLGAHKSIRTKLKATAEKIILILLKNKLVRHPTSKFSTDIQPFDIPKSTTVIYAIEDKANVTPDWNVVVDECNDDDNDDDDDDDDADADDDDDDDADADADADGVTAAAKTDSNYLNFDDVDDDEEEDEDDGSALEKIGMTRNYNQRALSDPKRYNRGKVILSAGMIQEKADEKLNLILNEFIDDIIEDEAVPAPIRRFLIIYRDRGADDLGLRSQFYYQLLEIALQYEYNQGSPAEAFSFDEDEYKCRVDNVDMIVTKMESLFSKYKGKNIRFLSNWNTGANAENFSSQICMTEYAANGSPWKDTLPEAVFPNAKTLEEIFSEEFDNDALTKGRETFHEEVKNNKINKGILFTTHQKQLFKGKDGLHRELVEWGYHPTCYIMEEDLIIYVDEDEESMIPIYAPLGVGIDARDTIDLMKSIRRLQLGEVLHRFVLFLNNKEHTVGQANAIDAGFVLESCIQFNHQGKRQACAITRDAITPEEAYPCIKNGLAKSKGKDVAPQAKIRRLQRQQQQQQQQQQQLSSNNKTNNDNDVDDDDDSNIDEDYDEYNPCRKDRYSVIRACNHLSHSNQPKLITTLLEIFDAFRINEDTNQPTSNKVRVRRRKRFFGLLRPGSELKHRVEEFWKSIRANTGSTKSHPKKYGGLAPNGIILRYVCLEGKKFWIRLATPETPEDDAIGPPDDGNDVVYSNRYVLQGLRSALSEDKTKKKKKNIKRQWRPDTRHGVVQISKVYSFPHHDDRLPILFREKSMHNKTPEGSTNGSTWILCVVKDVRVKLVEINGLKPSLITTDKIWERTFLLPLWERTFLPGSTSINNELIVCAVFKTILQSAGKIYIYPIVGENAINRINRYLNCICTDFKDKIAGENETERKYFRSDAIYNIRKLFSKDDQKILKKCKLAVTKEKFAKLTEVVLELLCCHIQQYINLVSIIESKHVVERLVKNAFKVGCEECDIDNIDDSFIDQPLKQFARHLWKIHGAN